MARLFDKGDSEYIQNNNAVVTSPGFAFVLWFKPSSVTSENQLLVVGQNGQSQNTWRLFTRPDDATFDGQIMFAIDARNGGDGGRTNAQATTGVSVDTWHHCCGIEAANDDHRVLLDNGGKATNSATAQPGTVTAVNTTVMGRRMHLSGQLNGSLAEAAIYDLSVYPGATDSDKADNFEDNVLPALAEGFSPLFFPLGLKAYWPLIGRTSPEIDRVGGYDMTLNSSGAGPVAAAHSRIIYPSTTQYGVAAAAAGLSPAVAAYYYRMLRTGGC